MVSRPTPAAQWTLSTTSSQTTSARPRGRFRSPPTGRLVEWFAPSYKTSCILYGPTSGGWGATMTTAPAALAQPGMMTAMPNGNLLLPQAGSSTGGFPGDVLEFDHSSFPTSATQCPDGVYPRATSLARCSSRAASAICPFRWGWPRTPRVAATPSTPSSAVGAPMTWSTGSTLTANRWPDPGSTASRCPNSGPIPNGFNPFGMAFAPDGTLYFIDIHIECTNGFSNCGPQNYLGRVMRITFGPGKEPSAPK